MSGGYSASGGGEYLAGLRPAQRKSLQRLNEPGIEALHEILVGGKAVAFLGAGASAPLYPLWDGVIDDLLTHARGRMKKKDINEARELAREYPDVAVELVRQKIGAQDYRDILREIFNVRRDPETGLTWTPVQELVARSPYAGVVTTNYDTGILNARIAVRPGALSTGFATWDQEASLDSWRTGDVFGEEELPILFAHGQGNQPDNIVLATTEYRRAYRGKLARVLRQILDVRHVVWIGFSFADQRIAAILRAIGDESGTQLQPGQDPRHVAVIGWDPDVPRAVAPESMCSIMRIEFGCRVVIYPVSGSDHSALPRLLERFADSRFPPAVPSSARQLNDLLENGEETIPSRQDGSGKRIRRPPTTAAIDRYAGPVAGGTPVTEKWVHGGESVNPFIGRLEEINRLDRWVSDPQTRLIGVTAWGGAGKTALVTEWLRRRGGAAGRAFRGVFAWSFYEVNSGDVWAEELLKWMAEEFGFSSKHKKPTDQVLDILTRVPVLLVMDGLEVLQEGSNGNAFGRLLDGTLRSVLTELCQVANGGLIVLTSRFPFADVEQFDGGAARMLDVPPFTPLEGAALLRDSASWLPEQECVDLVRAIDGHALAVVALAGALANHPPAADLRALHEDLKVAQQTNKRMVRVLQFYADRLSRADTLLICIVAMFQRSVKVDIILRLGTGKTFDHVLRDWTRESVEEAVRQRLGGLLSWYADNSVAAHPLVRETFRASVLSADSAKLVSSIQLDGVPAGQATSREYALTVVESIELLIEARQWSEADDLYRSRTNSGQAWKDLPAVRLGQRCGAAFVATPALQAACESALSSSQLSYYLSTAGLFGMYAGDTTGSLPYLEASAAQSRSGDQRQELVISLGNLAECFISLGEPGDAQRAAAEATKLAAGANPTPAAVVAHAYLAATLDLAGDTEAAEREFVVADDKMLTARGVHLYSLWAGWWAEFLLRTGRLESARNLSSNVTGTRGSSIDLARRNRLLGRCDLAGDLNARELKPAGVRLQSAVDTFKDGDCLIELARTLPDLAEHRRLTGELSEADRFCGEAIAIASPRHQVPALASALIQRARVRHDQYLESRNAQDAERARDDADAALRLATAHKRLPWSELGALEAHAALDLADDMNRGFADRSAQLRSTLVPPGLMSDPVSRISPLQEGKYAHHAGNDSDLVSPRLAPTAESDRSGGLPGSFDLAGLGEEDLEELIERLRRKPSRRALGGRHGPAPTPSWDNDS